MYESIEVRSVGRDYLAALERGVAEIAGLPQPELDDFEPFDPDEELRLREVLEAETLALMNEINALLDPAYRWGEDVDGDGLEGVARFFD